MRYYIDTEFNERGHEHPMELISLAMVREDGAELYAVLEDGWSPEHSNDWVKANVLPHLGESRHPWIDKRQPRVKRRDLARTVTEWISRVDSKPEFWGYYADYDWVLFCQLFGTMMDLPNGFPMFCRDLVQESERLGLTEEMKSAVPIQGHAHNALDDARNIKARHEWLMTKEK